MRAPITSRSARSTRHAPSPSNYRPQPALLEWWHETMTVPSVAIGGITPENCVPLVEAGADFIAVVTAVFDQPDPGAAVGAFNRVFDAASG